MALFQDLISCALLASLLLLFCRGHCLAEAAHLKQLVSETRPDSDVSDPVEQRLLLSGMIKDQDFALGGISSRHLLQSQPNLCSGPEVQCPSGIAECYNQFLRCDGANDCSDGSDEEPGFCSTFQCASIQAKCPSNKCTFTSPIIPRRLPKQFLCDGVQDCRDNSDEDPAFCASFDCVAAGSVTCPGPIKQCIPLRSQNNTFPTFPFYNLPGIPTSLCDGVIDCKDGSDEEPAFCASYSCVPDSFKCQNNQCIAGTKVCNGVADCPDGGTDEDPVLCGPGFNCSLAALGLEIPFSLPVKCPSGSGCYPGNGTNCDGRFNCFDRSDEDPELCGVGPSPITPPPSDTPVSTPGAPAPTETAPSSTPQATTAVPSPSSCDPNSATPNRCFNAPGTASICCSGQCPENPTDTPTCGPGPCDPTSSLPNACLNDNGSQSVCCPGNCPQNPGPSPRCD